MAQRVMLRVWHKADLIREYEEILGRGPLSTADRNQLLQGGGAPPGVIVQASSGSTQAPLLIPRSQSDVADIARRVAALYVVRVGAPPARTALIGGISHAEATLKLQTADMQMESFAPDQLAAIESFQPQAISCYPSVVRELIADGLKAPALRCIKLGGEPVLPADLRKIFAAFPDLFVIEQFGSTEMPAVALRCITATDLNPPFELQTGRFTFLEGARDGWQPVVVRDDFPDLLFPIGGFYDTGDEFLWRSGRVYFARRRSEPGIPYLDQLSAFLDEGNDTVQLDPAHGIVRVTGRSASSGALRFQDLELKVLNERPIRLKPSNKAPLVLT